jgi:hypothetical protein
MTPNPRKYLGLSAKQKAGALLASSRQGPEMNSRLAKIVAQDRFIDPYELFCSASPKRCRIFTAEGRLIFYDGWHLTRDGAAFFGRLLAQTSALRPYAPTPKAQE